MKNTFIHHVYFWLKNPNSEEDRKALVEGLKGLATCPDIQISHIGIPAQTKRDVIETSYAVSWLATFANAAAQDVYQNDPIHLAFVERCSHLWAKVIVYDSIDA